MNTGMMKGELLTPKNHKRIDSGEVPAFRAAPFASDGAVLGKSNNAVRTERRRSSAISRSLRLMSRIFVNVTAGCRVSEITGLPVR